jgi:hypothetical protein
MKPNKIILLCIVSIVSIIIVIANSMYFAMKTETDNTKEGYTPNIALDQIIPIDSTGLKGGYFKIVRPNGTIGQAPIPYGYKLDPNDNSYQNLIPATNVAHFEQIAPYITKPPGAIPTPVTYNIHALHYTPKNTDGTPSSVTAPVPPGYGVDSNGNLILISTINERIKMFKTDYTIDPGSNKQIVGGGDRSNPSIDPETINYKKDNSNVEYHSADTSDFKDNLASQGSWIKDGDGKLSYMAWSDISGSITYYQPDAYPYGPSSYVPNYEDSIYLSKSTGLSEVKQFYNADANAAGFCQQSGKNLELKCNALDTNTCASTSCCVLLGGAKCVTGDQNGPTIKSNYSDLSIRNKDYYYYQGKCYGNCSGSNPFFTTNATLPPNSTFPTNLYPVDPYAYAKSKTYVSMYEYTHPTTKPSASS